MTYTPQPGDIGLVRVHGVVGLDIRVGQWILGDGFADYEHAFVVVNGPSEISSGLLLEAEPGGARVHTLDKYASDQIRWLKCPPQYGAAVAEAAMSLRGVGYSYLGYMYLGAHRFHLPVPGLKGIIEHGKDRICSQLADEAAQLGGWHIFSDGRWSGDVTPGDLDQVYLAQQ